MRNKLILLIAILILGGIIAWLLLSFERSPEAQIEQPEEDFGLTGYISAVDTDNNILLVKAEKDGRSEVLK